jgi:hypothetical protein
MANKAIPTSNPSGFGEHRQGDPDIPEERNPRGHDAQPNPTRPGGRETPAPVPSVATEPSPRRRPSKSDDAKFLVDEFDVPEARAAELVARPDQTADITRDLHERESDDALEGVPRPQEPTQDITADSDEERLKPVLKTPNERSGGG